MTDKDKKTIQLLAGSNSILEDRNKLLKKENKKLTKQLALCGVGNWFTGLNETPIEERLQFRRFVLVKNNNGSYKVDRYDYENKKWMYSAWDKNETKWQDLPS